MDSKWSKEGQQAEITSRLFSFEPNTTLVVDSVLWAKNHELAPEMTVFRISEAGYPEQVLVVIPGGNVTIRTR